jgi:hypothetical protein
VKTLTPVEIWTFLGAKNASLLSRYRGADDTAVFVNQYNVTLSSTSTRDRPRADRRKHG